MTRLQILMVNLRQEWVLQLTTSLGSPVQFDPPYQGIGLSHVRVFVVLPPPQSSEHVPFTQSLYPPSTARRKNDFTYFRTPTKQGEDVQ